MPHPLCLTPTLGVRLLAGSVQYSEMVRALPGMAELSGVTLGDPRQDAPWRDRKGRANAPAKGKGKAASAGRVSVHPPSPSLPLRHTGRMSRGTMLGKVRATGARSTWECLVPATPHHEHTHEPGSSTLLSRAAYEQESLQPDWQLGSRLPTPLGRFEATGMLDTRYSLDQGLYNTRHSVAGMNAGCANELLPRPLPRARPPPQATRRFNPPGCAP
jgi:hypothetical protein